MKTLLVFTLVLLMVARTLAQDACAADPCPESDLKGPCYERPNPSVDSDPPYLCECPALFLYMGPQCLTFRPDRVSCQFHVFLYMGPQCLTFRPGNLDKETCFGDSCRTGEFTSPNFGDGRKYNNRHRQTYLLYIPGATEIAFTFDQTVFQIEVDKDELYLGPGLAYNVPMRFMDQDDPLQYVFEGLSAPTGTYVIPGDTAYLVFDTDKTIELEGWKVTWEMTGYDPCKLDPCRNEGTCIPTIDNESYTCLCTACWLGETCEIPTDLCTTANSCQNNAECTMLPSCLDVSCSCVGCYSGPTCSIFLDQCAPNPCQNEGTCTREVGSCTSFNCQCTPCFQGDTCITPVDLCQVNNPCVNGQCVMHESCEDVSCVCNSCWVGDNCATQVNQCDGNPCQNGGTCIQMQGCVQYLCTCTGCYTGDNCETLLNPCNDAPCANGGTCIAVPGSCTAFTCNCAQCYVGTNCQIYLDPCSPDPCQNGGTCAATDCNTYQCTCVGCYTGTTCLQYRLF
ncbi:uncharacterized protein LOC144435553 [Glandiceps talaboti]